LIRRKYPIFTPIIEELNRTMTLYKKEKKFLEIPRYAGGKEALGKFLKQHLEYPKEALSKGVEGKVVVGFEIDDDGHVHNPEVLHGIGYGCDEEALRLVKMLQYQKVNNRGKRVRVHSKININFKIPGQKLNYTITKTNPKQAAKPDNPKQETYSYTINLNN